MPKITPDKLEPGMKLLKPVMNRSGMVLLGEGTELTAELIEKIKDMDADSISIYGTAPPSTPKEEMLSAIDGRFKAVEEEPYMGTIKKVLKEHIEGLYG
ncbi:MAG: hypothetical protein A4E64_02275 [Syntrophorhabdus sp. PtaU1.Bin058]|nr:MAG: hypothetical protein A4E64_02275 [Syntrophorhabdus sp. PtaU1.Bin058]